MSEAAFNSASESKPAKSCKNVLRGQNGPAFSTKQLRDEIHKLEEAHKEAKESHKDGKESA